MKMRCLSCILSAVFFLLLAGTFAPALADDPTPLEFLQAQEWANRDTEGEVYLGKVMTIRYEPYTVGPPDHYHPYILELTDVIKTPIRASYRLVLKGYTDTSGDLESNFMISLNRAETLKRTIIEKYYMDGDRITAEGYGPADPVASNATAEGRRLNRRVEIHVYGDVSQAVRFLTPGEEGR